MMRAGRCDKPANSWERTAHSVRLMAPDIIFGQV